MSVMLLLLMMNVMTKLGNDCDDVVGTRNFRSLVFYSVVHNKLGVVVENDKLQCQ